MAVFTKKRVQLPEADRIEISRSYASGTTAVSLREKYNVSAKTLHNILKEFGLNSPRRVDHFDEHFFREIDNEIKAYWLGFIYADGNVWDNSLKIEVHESDKGHLEKIRAALSSSAKMRYRPLKSSWTVSFHSKNLVEDLKSHGVFPNKSRIIEAPSLPVSLMRHFYRGFIDGDGWVSRRKSTGALIVGICSMSAVFVKQFRNWTSTNLKTANAITQCKSGINQLSFEGEKANVIANHLYSYCCVALDRKLKTFNTGV